MPSTPLESSPPLSAVELQVLTLLARGHTTKSIAATLDLSVYAVNERLREARRKTGAASSRELARRLATQENWDKQIGVPDENPHSAEPESPSAAIAARRRSRSFVIMLAIVSVFGLAVVALQVVPPPAAMRKQGASAPASGVSRSMAPLSPYRARFDAEARNNNWAAPAELRTLSLFTLVDGVQSIEVHCAATLCRVEGAVLPDALKRVRSGVEGATLRDRLREAGLEVVATDFRISPDAAEPGKFTTFLTRTG
ncbi:helix-turn-helix transcriptional regulator [Sphingomonas sp. R86520]|uniref:helix-turn-helix domain-containing protein n=1 Tax=Sphingomonas sp. R86520 TaxID=3093859 RepID=UPI0036D23A96